MRPPTSPGREPSTGSDHCSHRGHADLNHTDWTGERRAGSYSDSKLFLTTLALAVARLWPQVPSNAVDPGWVPTRMGGPNAPDDLRKGHLTHDDLDVAEGKFEELIGRIKKRTGATAEDIEKQLKAEQPRK